VIGVTDGDTIKVLFNKKSIKIRLYGIDTPEKRQDFGTKAKQYISKIIFGKTVKIIPVTQDGYGRLVAMVYSSGLSDKPGVSANEQIIKNGYAWVYKKYCKKSFCREWLQYEEDARKEKIGLWSHKDPVPPCSCFLLFVFIF